LGFKSLIGLLPFVFNSIQMANMRGQFRLFSPGIFLMLVSVGYSITGWTGLHQKSITGTFILSNFLMVSPYSLLHAVTQCTIHHSCSISAVEHKIAAVKATSPERTFFRSPWQNGIAERWVGSCRRDLLDHIVALNERHLKRLLAEYVRYHHEDRTHLGLEKATPDGRMRSVASGRVLAQERVGALHHRYDRAA
jgi:hypothetical protein